GGLDGTAAPCPTSQQVLQHMAWQQASGGAWPVQHGSPSHIPSIAPVLDDCEDPPPSPPLPPPMPPDPPAPQSFGWAQHNEWQHVPGGACPVQHGSPSQLPSIPVEAEELAPPEPPAPPTPAPVLAPLDDAALVL